MTTGTMPNIGRPTALEVVPAELKARDQWVCFRIEERQGKTTKVPYDPKTGNRASSTDPSTWNSFTGAVEASGDYDGIGFVFSPSDPFFGLDLDKVRDPDTGAVEPWALEIVQALDTYTEISISGTGIHTIGEGKVPPGGNRKGQIEMYDHGRYFCMSGNPLPGTPQTIEHRQQALDQLHRETFKTPAPTPPRDPHPLLNPTSDDDLIGQACRATNGAKFQALLRGDWQSQGYTSQSEADQAFANMLAFWTGRDAARMDTLFRQSGLYRPKWDDRHGPDTYGNLTIGKAIQSTSEVYTPRNGHHKSNGKPGPSGNPKTYTVEEADPLRLAEHFIQTHYTQHGKPTIRRAMEAFWTTQKMGYEEIEPEILNVEIYNHLDRLWLKVVAKKKSAQDDGGAGEKTALAKIVPTRHLVGEVRAALPACGIYIKGQMPQWLDGRTDPDPQKVIAFQNGILIPETRTLIPPTTELFTSNVTPLVYDPEAPAPRRWLTFINELFPDDREAIELLQELFGLSLTQETKYQKIPFILGPRRSGKGTIARILTALVGAHNVCSPTLSSLSSPFGMQTLIGKSLAIISDARLSGRTDSSSVIERLLSISGEDCQTIPRKYADDITLRLPVRFWILTNEVPRFGDCSGALASRFLVLRLTQSFLGAEDLTLEDKLKAELPGILLWSLDGLDRLNERGRFQEPESSRELVGEIEDLQSPIGAFLKDRCFIGPEYLTECHAMFAAWEAWCRDSGRDYVGNIQVLGRDLRAAIPMLQTPQRRDCGQVRRFFEGVGLRAG